jgi:hypothetical protein
MAHKSLAELDRADIAALVEARHVDPFAVLGPHKVAGRTILRAFVPNAERLEIGGLHRLRCCRNTGSA